MQRLCIHCAKETSPLGPFESSGSALTSAGTITRRRPRRGSSASIDVLFRHGDAPSLPRCLFPIHRRGPLALWLSHSHLDGQRTKRTTDLLARSLAASSSQAATTARSRATACERLRECRSLPARSSPFSARELQPTRHTDLGRTHLAAGRSLRLVPALLAFESPRSKSFSSTSSSQRCHPKAFLGSSDHLH